MIILILQKNHFHSKRTRPAASFIRLYAAPSGGIRGTMRKTSMHITTFVILISILTTLAQFCLYYFADFYSIIFGTSTIVILLFTHILFVKFKGYDSCFSYLLLNTFLWSIIIILSYFGGKDAFLIYQWNLIYFIVLNWGITVLYCLLRSLLDRSSRYTNFNAFFRNCSILFLIYYTGTLIYAFYLSDNIIGYGNNISGTINIIPFISMATIITDYINKAVTLDFTILYFIKGILLFVPYGFYVVLLLRHKNRLLRGAALLILPVILEIVQMFLLNGKPDVDDILLAWIGGFLGGLFYHLINVIFNALTDHDFLAKQYRGFYSNRNLHF